MQIEKELFTQQVLSGMTIPDLMKYYSCSRNKVAEAKKKYDLVGATPNSKKLDRVSGLKVCKNCNLDKPLNDFYTNGLSETGLTKYKPNCNKCENLLRKATLEDSIMSWLHSQGLSYNCSICDITGPFGFLDFHHVNPEDKLFNIGDSSKTSNFETTVVPELEKCVLLCPNCHRKEHLIMGSK